jgi:hypothetical protein
MGRGAGVGECEAREEVDARLEVERGEELEGEEERLRLSVIVDLVELVV